MADELLQIGSSVIPLYVERRMKIYAVTEGDFSSLSALNAQTTIFSSVGLALLSVAVSIWINAVFYVDVPPAAYVAKIFVAPVLALLAVVFFILARHSAKNSASTWETIKSESVARASA